MSRWDEQFKKHPIHLMLKEINHLLSERLYTDNKQRSEKRRISKLINIFEEVLKNIDPELTPRQILHDIFSILEDVQRQLVSYSSTGDHDYLRGANDSMDNALKHLSQLLSIAKRSEAMQPVKGLEKLLDELAKNIYDRKQLLEDEIREMSKLSKTQDEKLRDLSNSINAKRQETDSLISSWQEQYSHDQSERNRDFAKRQQEITEIFTIWKNDFEEKAKIQFDQLVNTGNEKIFTEQEKFINEISSLTEDANKKHKQILDLYGLVASNSVASGYLKNAEDEKKQADFWRWGTIVFIALTALWLIASYIVNYMNFSWERVIATIPVTGILIFGAVYSSKQSSLHRQNEKRTRWFSLEMKAIGPFIESLPEEERNNLKSKISERLFGQQHKNIEEEASVINEHAFKTIIKGIADVMKTK